MTVILAILGIWLALNVAIFFELMHRADGISRADKHWMKLHPNMPLWRRPVQ